MLFAPVSFMDPWVFTKQSRSGMYDSLTANDETGSAFTFNVDSCCTQFVDGRSYDLQPRIAVPNKVSAEALGTFPWFDLDHYESTYYECDLLPARRPTHD